VAGAFRGSFEGGEEVIYKLEKISDLLLVPIDRREACMRDVLYGLALHELAFGEDAQKTMISGVQWTDDDDHSATIHDTDGATVLSLKMTKDMP
jgi:hypothetical protein